MRGRGPRRDPSKEQFWRKTLARQESSGLSVREFCALHNLAEPAFYACAARSGGATSSPARALDGHAR